MGTVALNLGRPRAQGGLRQLEEGACFHRGGRPVSVRALLGVQAALWVPAFLPTSSSPCGLSGLTSQERAPEAWPRASTQPVDRSELSLRPPGHQRALFLCPFNIHSQFHGPVPPQHPCPLPLPFTPANPPEVEDPLVCHRGGSLASEGIHVPKANETQCLGLHSSWEKAELAFVF